VPNNKWTATLPAGADPIFKTKVGVWQRAVNITSLFKNDAHSRVGNLTPFVPESAKRGDIGNGKSEETGRNFSWSVDLVT